jgi:hypothetical protein
MVGSLSAGVLLAAPNVTIEYNSNEEATSAFHFKSVPPPTEHDAAQNAVISLVQGALDQNSGGLGCLNDGKVPGEDDQPSRNFFLNAGTQGGVVVFDLGKEISLREIHSYSWHAGGRAAQVYRVFGASGEGAGFVAKPEKGTDFSKAGWTELATVDTRSAQKGEGGQFGVKISGEGALGNFRYLLFEIAATSSTDRFGNTFYSEIDVLDKEVPAASAVAQNASEGRQVVTTGEGKYQIVIDTSETPDLREWVNTELVPVVKEWYPRIVDALPSKGYEAPTHLSIYFSNEMRGVAATGGTRIRCAADWFRGNLKGEAKGAIYHEMVHVVQQYGRARRDNPSARPTPGWIVEGIPDYLRWYHFEPDSKGAEITARNISRAKYDGSYRPSANFLNWVTTNYHKDIVVELNAAARSGKYDEEIWTKATGKTVEELGSDWKEQMEKNIAAKKSSAGAPSPAETGKEGEWKSLFNGKDFAGWHVFRTKEVKPGWQVQDGVLVCADPHQAGDLCTDEQFDWFELELEYNISEGGNSGIMYHVTNKGRAAWATGPEFQLEDNKEAKDPQRCGWLYALYQPPIDPATGKPLDATKPAGEWNKVRLVISPKKCEHYINGVKYLEYNLHSDEFKERVEKSKFGKMPNFARSDKGFICLQGDHGQVKFRNIRIKPITVEK